jgi:hypothetical protein
MTVTRMVTATRRRIRGHLFEMTRMALVEMKDVRTWGSSVWERSKESMASYGNRWDYEYLSCDRQISMWFLFDTTEVLFGRI